MGDPYWRYGGVGGGGGGRPSSLERGHISKETFPGYLPSETSTLSNYNSYSAIDPRIASSDILQKDILPSRPGAYGIDDRSSVRAEPSISGLVAGASYRGYPHSASSDFLHKDILPSRAEAYGIDGIPSVCAEPSVSGLDAGASYRGYPHSASSDFLHKDMLPSRAGAYGIDNMPSVRDEPSSGCYRGYPSSFEDPNLLVHHKDVASGRTPGIPDVGYDRPNSMTRTDGNPAPAAESNVLFINGLPTDCTRREIGHLFRPFTGFREIRLIHKEPRRRGDKAMVLCFVEFTDSKCAHTAMEALQGYKFDNKKPNSPLLKIHFAHFPFRLPSDQNDPPLGATR